MTNEFHVFINTKKDKTDILFQGCIFLDFILKLFLIFYNPFLILYLILSICGFLGFYYKNIKLLFIYIGYELVCVGVSIYTLFNIYYTKLQIILIIGTNFWYVYLIGYLIESILMTYFTCKIIININKPLSDVNESFVIN